MKRCKSKRISWEPFGLLACSRRPGHAGSHRAWIKRFMGGKGVRGRKHYRWGDDLCYAVVAEYSLAQ